MDGHINHKGRFDDISADGDNKHGQHRDVIPQLERTARQSFVQLLNTCHTVDEVRNFYPQIVAFPFQSMQSKNNAYAALNQRVTDIVHNVLRTFRSTGELVKLQRDLLDAEFVSENTLQSLQRKIETSMRGAETV